MSIVGSPIVIINKFNYHSSLRNFFSQIGVTTSIQNNKWKWDKYEIDNLSVCHTDFLLILLYQVQINAANTAFIINLNMIMLC